jgi:hypothetical protein
MNETGKRKTASKTSYSTEKGGPKNCHGKKEWTCNILNSTIIAGRVP